MTNLLSMRGWGRISTAGYGEIGRARLTIGQDNLFLTDILDRDQPVRFDTGELRPRDGVANVAPLWIPQNAPEDVY